MAGGARGVPCEERPWPVTAAPLWGEGGRAGLPALQLPPSPAVAARGRREGGGGRCPRCSLPALSLGSAAMAGQKELPPGSRPVRAQSAQG